MKLNVLFAKNTKLLNFNVLNVIKRREFAQLVIKLKIRAAATAEKN